ncbi:MAG: hypothetical protein VCF07_04795, partial [Nitrospinota bacterium]
FIPDGFIKKNGTGNPICFAGIVDNARIFKVGTTEGKVYSCHSLFVWGGHLVRFLGQFENRQ